MIEAHEGRPLKLYVYNTETDHCREVREPLILQRVDKDDSEVKKIIYR